MNTNNPLNAIYVGQHVTGDANVSKIETNAVAWLIGHHDQAKTTQPHLDVKNNDSTAKNYQALVDQAYKQIKNTNSTFFLASAFGTIDDPKQPLSSPRSTRKNGGILRDYVAIDYDLTTQDDADKLKENALDFFTKQHNFDFILYPSISYPTKPHLRLVTNIATILDKNSYKTVATALIDKLGVLTNDLVANTTISHNFNAPIYVYGSHAEEFTIYNQSGQSMTIDALNINTKDLKSKTTRKEYSKSIKDSASYNDSQLTAAVNAFIENPKTKKLLSDYNEFWHFAESLAEARLKSLVSQEFVDTILQKVAYGNTDWEKSNPEVYETQYEKLKSNPDKRTLVKSLNSYLPITAQVQQTNPNIINLSQLLLKLLPSNFEGDTEIEVRDAADIISQYFEFSLLPNIEADADAIAIFDPLKGVWTHDTNNLIAMLSIVKPAITKQQIQTAFTYWAAQANTNNKFIKPYSGSQYLVFKNVVLDIITMKKYPLSADFVAQQYFTNRHIINIDYDPNVKLQVFEHDGLEGSDWDIVNFLKAYADNDPEIYQYFLFGLSLGLFAGHNSGVHFDISGPSGFGKSTLVNIFRGLYQSRRIADIKFSNLNKDFPMNNYDYATSIIWISEANANTSGLDEDNGTPFYDSLADLTARLPVKHQGDVIVDNPPQVYVDGTQLVQSTDLNSGPARRTLPFVLPLDPDRLRKQFYSNNIAERLQDPENLKYLVNLLIEAFKAVVPLDRQANFKMNLGVPEDLELIPAKVRAWREEALLGSDDTTAWFEELILPALIVNNEVAWIHDTIFYELYRSWYIGENPNDPNGRYAKRQPRLINELRTLFQKHNIYCIKAVEKDGNRTRARKMISGPDALAINWSEYNKVGNRPESLTNTSGMPNFFGKRKTDVYRLVTTKPNPLYYSVGTDGMYTPI